MLDILNPESCDITILKNIAINQKLIRSFTISRIQLILPTTARGNYEINPVKAYLQTHSINIFMAVDKKNLVILHVAGGRN